MAWYNAGTVSVANNSATVTGAGTAFADNVDAGQSFVGPDGLAYEILSVLSATQITISPNYRGPSASGQAYRIMPVQGYLRDLANQAAQLVLSFATVRDGVGQGKFPDGVVGTPGIRFASDEDTGIYRPGANLLGLVTNGIERVRIDAGGNVGVGGTSPTQRLDVRGSIALTGTVCGIDNTGVTLLSGGTVFQSGGASIALRASGSSYNPFGMEIFTNNAERVRVDASGNVGIGAAAPAFKLDVNGDINSSGTGVLRLRGLSGFIAQHDGSNAYVRSETGAMYLGAGGANRWLINASTLAPTLDNTYSLGAASNRANTIFAGTGVINTSDERTKQDVDAIPDEWLDAWSEVEWCRYKFRDAVEAKGDGRWHVGLIAQRVRDAFAALDLDATEIGLLCYDEWDEEREPIMEERQIDTEIVVVGQEATGLFLANGEPHMRDITEERPIMGMVDTGETRVTLEAGNRWGLRYDECQAMEAAWQRRELARKDAAIAALETAVATMAAQIDALSAPDGE